VRLGGNRARQSREAGKDRESPVAVTCFASSLARVGKHRQVACRPPRDAPRACRAGASSHVRDEPPILAPFSLLDFPALQKSLIRMQCYLPRDSAVICNRQAGRAAVATMAKLANTIITGDLFLEAGDNTIFSSRVIPGNDARSAACRTPDPRRLVVTDPGCRHPWGASSGIRRDGSW